MDTEQPQDTVKENDRPFSTPEKMSTTTIDEWPSRDAAKKRASLTFVCRTDIDRIKALTPEIVTTNRRQSLAKAVKRRQSIATTGPGINVRKFSTPLMFARKMSLDSNPGAFGIPTLEEQRRLNKLLSLPATITDVSENEEELESNVKCPTTVTKF